MPGSRSAAPNRGNEPLTAGAAPKADIHGAGEVVQRFIEELENDDERRAEFIDDYEE
jgi:hypothetical protein